MYNHERAVATRCDGGSFYPVFNSSSVRHHALLLIPNTGTPIHPLTGFKYILPEGYAALSLLQTTEEVNRETASSIYHDSMGIDEEDDSDENGACHMVPSVKRKPPGKNWTAVHSSPSITLWGHDTAPTRVDPGRRALDFLTVADKVHTPVTPEQVAEKLRLIQAQ